MSDALQAVYKVLNKSYNKELCIKGNSAIYSINSIPVDAKIRSEERHFDCSTKFYVEVEVYNIFELDISSYTQPSLTTRILQDYKNGLLKGMTLNYKESLVIPHNEKLMQIDTEKRILWNIINRFYNDSYNDVRNQIIKNNKNNNNIKNLNKYESSDKLSKKFKLEDIRRC
jgi:hypothetical protein